MLNARNIKIGDKVFCIRKFGDYRTGYDIQIIRYRVKYKGIDKFIPEGFMDLKKCYQEISYSDCYKSLDEAKEVITKQFSNYDVVFKEQYQGSYYDVLLYMKRD